MFGGQYIFVTVNTFVTKQIYFELSIQQEKKKEKKCTRHFKVMSAKGLNVGVAITHSNFKPPVQWVTWLQ